ncbi:ascorbate 6-phosphate lactonase [Dolosigranulum pigrum]|uniref:Ascorbate 6-phosphate lactonase n=1 Tax=Dolosigranulum pigrum TaxID=29394 RepID=A0A1S8KMW9_9LACT|nr:transcription antiterminator [Dolosigranulum pigrum]OOL81078.1 ascorbate 6-phosphate lactonase [Dolosigranulum pigrum]QTJ33147.1 transcription antiterminator [Dolosigranulum pigrum]QTJ41736.1 transcription antiterminator [Dolosigranulum pigrum]RAN53185.1 ascorbate 6-phosphate lactonase [Dolosigranulum pigrum]
MLLDQTSCELLRYLINLMNPKTIMAISRDRNQSRRAIYYQLDKINDAIGEHCEPIISQSRVGIILSEQQKQACKKILEEIDAYSYIMSSKERKQLILFYICIAKERVTLDKLMDLTEVSRNTVINDLNDIREDLIPGQYQVKLQVTKSKGYYLQCKPLSKIQYTQSLLYHIFRDGSPSYIKIAEEKITKRMKNELLLSIDVRTFLSEQIPVVQGELGKIINNQEIAFMLQILPYLLLSCRSTPIQELPENYLAKEFHLIHRRIEFQVAQDLASRLRQKFSINLSGIEISLLGLLLLSYRKDKDTHVDSQDFTEIKNILEQFIWQIEAAIQIEIEQKEDLIRNLVTHCKALLFRKTYGIFSRNPLTTQIKDKYYELFNIVQSVSMLLEEEWLITLTDDEIAYLTIHIGGSLKKPQLTKEGVQKICIVCDEGIGISKLLLKQCQSYIQHDYIKAVLNTEQFKSVEDLLDIDLIVSTNKELSSQYPILKVNPILTSEDILGLTYYIKYREFKGSTISFNEALEITIKKYLSDSGSAKALTREITHLINNELLSQVTIK